VTLHTLFDEVQRLAGEWTIRARVYAYDKWHHVETWQYVDLATLNIESPHRADGINYEPSSAATFHRAMRSLGVDHAEFTFLDIGAGKGKGMLLASRYPFRRIVGVEWSAELAAVASRNCQAYRSIRQKCRAFEVVCADASVYEIPDDPLVIYMYNPFRLPVLSAVASNIAASLARRRRKLILVYVGPQRADLAPLAAVLEPVRAARRHRIFESR
jgi:hypothetical protein